MGMLGRQKFLRCGGTSGKESTGEPMGGRFGVNEEKRYWAESRGSIVQVTG